MIYRQGLAPPETSRLFDHLIRTGTEETTQNGYTYVVSDPSAFGGLMTGEVSRRSNQSELLVIVNGSLEEPVRAALADISAGGENFLYSGRYRLPNAAEQYIRGNPNVVATGSLLSAMKYELAGTALGVRNDQRLSLAEKRRLLLEYSSSLGWVALHRQPTKRGEEHLNALTSIGLSVPFYAQDGLELAGSIKTSKGYRQASFTQMLEHSERHTCACCSAQILPKTHRVTLGFDQSDSYSDHHHYHATCFTDTMLGKFDFDTLRQQEAKIA